MNWTQYIWLVIAGALLMGCATRKDTQMKTISYSDVQSRVAIIGKCGYPLGTCIQIEGQWMRREGPTKADPRYFRVTSINGEKVQNAVEFSLEEIVAEGGQEMPKPGENAVWKLVGYESGGFFGTPEEALAALEQVVQAVRPYGFYVHFAFYKCRPM
jgi:hypothetical protein